MDPSKRADDSPTVFLYDPAVRAELWLHGNILCYRIPGAGSGKVTNLAPFAYPARALQIKQALHNLQLMACEALAPAVERLADRRPAIRVLDALREVSA